MSFSFGAAIAFTVLAVIAFLIRAIADYEARTAARVASIGLTAIAVIFTVLASVNIVSTRNVGVVTSFGKPVGTLTNGLHIVAPWKKVTELSGVIRTDSHTGGFGDGGHCSGGTPVRLANNSTACVDNTIRWRIVPEQADSLFRDYLNDDNIRDSLVTRELGAVLNGVFADYNPLAADATAGPRLDALSTTVTERLKAKVGTQIDIQNVIITLIHFDGVTQDRINAYQAQVANTRIAEAAKDTATAQAQANRILAESVTDPGVLTARCLDLINAGKPVPAGFQCFPGPGVAPSIPIR
ncbi:SPFH domain-containing protein [Nocardia cyriacigeorgica]|uniref:SPFH domain-containing protein n=1 Tax=Nocardia cyriacigeorgica TaxID=135487 RepID=UPI0018940B48|nr:SPFH domain-containing protein [Nocardia cyriacigeorgica]MBF6085176.1 SPFH domain-containing protein [Nocardia cyriacigeorgica]